MLISETNLQKLIHQERGKRYKNKLNEAENYFANVDSLSRGLGMRPKDQEVRGYVALSNLYLGMALDHEGRREEAIKSYQRVRALPKYGASHKLAKRYQRKPYQRP